MAQLRARPVGGLRAGSEEGPDHADRLAAKYGMARDEAEQAIARMTAAAAGEGLDFHLEGSLRSQHLRRAPVIHLAHDPGPPGRGEGAADAGLLHRGPAGRQPCHAGPARGRGRSGPTPRSPEVLDGDAYTDAVRADQDAGPGARDQRGAVLRRRPEVRRVRRPARPSSSSRSWSVPGASGSRSRWSASPRPGEPPTARPAARTAARSESPARRHPGDTPGTPPGDPPRARDCRWVLPRWSGRFA